MACLVLSQLIIGGYGGGGGIGDLFKVFGKVAFFEIARGTVFIG